MFIADQPWMLRRSWGRRDGSVAGGHLLGGEVWPTLEVIVTEVAAALAKTIDPETGLALLAPQSRLP